MHYCEKCGSELVEHTKDNIIIKECPNCKRLLFDDNQQYENIEGDYRFCPNCDEFLIKKEYYQTTVFECPICSSIYLSNGELTSCEELESQFIRNEDLIDEIDPGRRKKQAEDYSTESLNEMFEMNIKELISTKRYLELYHQLLEPLNQDEQRLIMRIVEDYITNFFNNEIDFNIDFISLKGKNIKNFEINGILVIDENKYEIVIKIRSEIKNQKLYVSIKSIGYFCLNNNVDPYNKKSKINKIVSKLMNWSIYASKIVNNLQYVN